MSLTYKEVFLSLEDHVFHGENFRSIPLTEIAAVAEWLEKIEELDPMPAAYAVIQWMEARDPAREVTIVGKLMMASVHTVATYRKEL